MMRESIKGKFLFFNTQIRKEMKKILLALLVAGSGIWATTAFAENSGYTRRAIPDTAIETGNGMWTPSPSVVYRHHPGWMAPSSPTQGSYVSANIGETEINNVDYFGNYNGFGHNNSGITMLGAIGYGFNNNCRLEGEVGYQTNDNHYDYGLRVNRNISVVSFLANGYFDIPVFGSAQPYITAGAGFATVNTNGFALPGGPADMPSIDETAFAYQIGLGVTVPIGHNISLDARYRYFTTNVTVDTTFENNRLTSNSVLLGLKIGI